jgi:hypothetical protein
MEILGIAVLAVGALGVLSLRCGADSRGVAWSAEQEYAAHGFLWERDEQPTRRHEAPVAPRPAVELPRVA